MPSAISQEAVIAVFKLSDPAWWNYSYSLKYLEDKMASSYSRFEWYFSGLTSKEAAESLLEESLRSFKSSHNENEWSVQSTVSNGPYGWRCGFTAVKEVQSG